MKELAKIHLFQYLTESMSLVHRLFSPETVAKLEEARKAMAAECENEVVIDERKYQTR